MAPALTAITDHVHFAQTDLVNWTLVTDGEGVLLIDAGFPGSRDDVLASLRQLGFGIDDVMRFCELARSRRFQVRFIEFMPLDADRTWSRDRVLPNAEVRRLIHAAYPLEEIGRERSGTSRRWRFADGQGEIGFISPVSEPFCGDCNRIRLTAEGELRTCLFSMTETDLREPLRNGASDDELEAIIRAAVWEKELKHHVNDEGFVQPARTMSQIGG